jgi:hypothetical protein
MWVNLLTVALSCCLLVYWFRYACLLILTARSAQDYATAVAQANALQFPQIQQKLEGAAAAGRSHLDALQRALDRDYKLLVWLMRHGAEFQVAGRQVEHKMLLLDYQLMRAWYACSKRMSLRRGRNALEEMVHIVRHFAGMMGERCAIQEARTGSC